MEAGKTTGPVGSAVLVVAVGWSAGIAASEAPGAPWPLLALLAGVALVAAVLAPSVRLRIVALGLMAVLLGMCRAGLATPLTSSDALDSISGTALVRGRIVDEPLPRGGRVETIVEVEAIAGERAAGETALSQPLPRVLVRAPTIRAGYGDRIEARGRVSRPRSRPGWPLAEMLTRRGVGYILDTGGVRVIEADASSPARRLTALRAAFEANTKAVLPGPQASLVAGMVFGARSGLPPDLKAAMSTTGTSHLTAVSGMNVALVAGALLAVLGRLLGRAPAGLGAIVGVWLYTILVGGPPSALRAATMATVALLVYALGRQPDVILALALAVAALLGWNPGLAFDLGFQLSVAATAGLILFASSIEEPLRWMPGAVRGPVAVALAAQIATLPIILGTFQRLSLVSLPANVLAAPLVVPIMTFGIGLAAVGWLPGLDVLLAWPAWLSASALLLVIDVSAAAPGAVVAVGRAPAWLPIVWYGALGCWALAGSADARALGLSSSALKAGGVACLAAVPLCVAGASLMPQGSGRAEIALLDVNPSAAFVRTPSGQTAVLTTGPAGYGLAASVGAQLEVWESTVDVLVGAGGIAQNVDLLAIGGVGDDDERNAEGRLSPVEPGTRIELGDGLAVQVVDVRRIDDRLAADVAIEVDRLVILLPGDGPPSSRWGAASSESATIAALPSSAVSWARSLPERPWLLLVGEPASERVRDETGIPFLSQREHGLVLLEIIADGTVTVRTERCGAGRDCRLELPPPRIQRLMVDSQPAR